MIKSRDGFGAALVTFTLPAAVEATRVAICGEWNDWSPEHDVMERGDDGFSLTVRLESGRSYRFRYLLDGQRWENDWAADSYAPNAFGAEDSVVDLITLSDPPALPAPPVPPSPPMEAPLVALVPPDVDGDEQGLVSSSLAREAKLMAPAGLTLPDLSGLLPGSTAVAGPVERLDATYYDTADLRLARSGLTLGYRSGVRGPAWTVKLPETGDGSSLVRREIRFEGEPGQVPNPAADLVLASSRGLTLEPVASLTTVRRPWEIRGEDGELLAEVVDDTVSVSRHQEPTGRFREIEVEPRLAGNKGRRILAAAVARLVEAGCDTPPPLPKLVRALGEAATRPPEVVVPPLGADATVIDLVRHATARSVAQIIRYDPGARLGDDPEDVHKLRVAARRLRSDLHSFGPLLQAARVDPIRAELSWLGAVVGAVRDTDVLADRLADRLAALPEIDAVGADRLLGVLDGERAAARAAMLLALRDARYLTLLDGLVELAASPPFVVTPAFSLRKSRKMASKIVQKPWRRVVAAVDELGVAPTDTQLHQVRILAKRSRYAAEAAAPLLGPAAARFASAVADVQTVLGDHQDTVLAEAWLRATVASVPDGGETVDQLIALEQARRSALRAEWPAVWRRASSKKLHSWR